MLPEEHAAFCACYARTEHARLSRRPVIAVTPANVHNVSRFQLEQHLLARGAPVTDGMATVDLRAAVRQDLAAAAVTG